MRKFWRNDWFGVVLGVVLIFAVVYILMLAVNAGAVGAAWLQAFGAVIGIVGAATFPYMHEAAKRRVDDERLREVLELLARNQKIYLERLLRVLVDAHVGKLDKHQAYFSAGYGRHWEPHREALNAIPIAGLNARQVDTLGWLKIATAFAVDVDRKFGPAWVFGMEQMNELWELQTFCDEADGWIEIMVNPEADN